MRSWPKDGGEGGSDRGANWAKKGKWRKSRMEHVSEGMGLGVGVCRDGQESR